MATPARRAPSSRPRPATAAAVIGTVAMVFVSLAAVSPWARSNEPATRPATAAAAAAPASTAPATHPTAAGFDSLPPEVRNGALAKLEDVVREVDRRRATEPAAADALAQDLARVRAMLAGRPARPDDDGGPEVHVVGMYAPQHWRKNEVVEVAATDGRPVILVLCAYEPVRWEVRLAEGATVQRVIVGGYHWQTLSWSDPARATPVEVYTYDDGARGEHFYAYRKGDDQYGKLVAAVKRLTDRDVATFNGMQRGTGGPHHVGPDSPAWYAQVVDAEVEPLYREATAPARARRPFDPAGAPGQVFKAVYASADLQPPRMLPNGRPMPVNPFNLPRVLADFTTSGPIEGTFQRLPERTAGVAVDPRGPVVYGFSNHEVLRLDPANGAGIVLPVRGDVPRLSWATGLAFDTKRNRLVLASRQYLYAYDPGKNEWSYVADLPQNGMAGGLAYSPADDSLYALASARAVRTEPAPDGGPQRPVVEGPFLLQLDAEGKQVRQVALSERLPAGFRPDAGPQLAMVGDRLAVVTPPAMTRADPRSREFQPGRCYLINPETGEVVSSEPMVPRPAASAAELSPAERDRLWRALGAEGDAEAERAAKRLVAAGDGAVTALAPRLVPAAVPPTAEAVRRSIEALDSPDVDARDRATADLLHAGPAVEPQLRAALDGAPSAEARSRLEQVLRDFEPAGPEGAATSGGVRRDARVVQVLGDIGTPAAVEQLIALTAAPAAPELRREAKAALREIGSPRPSAAVEP